MPRKLIHALLLSLVGILFLQLAPPASAVVTRFNDPGFEKTWDRVDKPVQELSDTARGYTWGPAVVGAAKITTEIYNLNPRTVQYFDKARMEVNNPQGDQNDLFYVTTGLLVKELVTGDRQDGDNLFTPLSPSQVQVAGDSNEGGANLAAPTYASFRNVGTFSGTENGNPNLKGSVVNSRIDKAGNSGTFSPPEQRVFTGYDEVTRHNIPDVFVDFGNMNGTIWNNNQYSQGPVFFGSSLYVLGRPLTEPYWVRTEVKGVAQDVLVQLFERRVLTYTPGNPAGFKVEMGNVGQHYYRWRYELRGGLTSPTQIATAVSQPVVGGDKIFWFTPYQNNSLALLEYDPASKVLFVVKQWSENYLNQNSVGGIASDGKIVTWIESRIPQNDEERNKPPVGKVRGFDLTSGKEFDIVEVVSGHSSFTMAVADSVLYYSDSQANHTGFFARQISDGSERKLSDSGGRYPVVKDGKILWTNLSYPAGPHLYMLPTSGNTQPQVLSTAPDNFGFSGYDVSGDKVVWSFSSPEAENKVFLYSISNGQTKPVSVEQGYNPRVNGNNVTWEIDHLSPAGKGTTAIQLYRIDTGKITTIAEEYSASLVGIASPNFLVFTRQGDQLCLVDLKSAG